MNARTVSITEFLDAIPDSWGPKQVFEDFGVALTSTQENSISFQAPAHCFIIHFAHQPERKLAINSDRFTCGFAPTGSLELFPFTSEVHSKWQKPKSNLLIAISDERLSRLAGAEFESQRFELHLPKIGSIDPKALTYATNIRTEMATHSHTNAELVDAWVTILGMHILRQYSNLGLSNQKRIRGGLSSRAWRQVNDYVHCSLHTTISLESLAKQASVSPGHFVRAFKQTAGVSPYQYVLLARLQRARELISSTTDPMEHIARSVGFRDNSHMASTMKRVLGVTPKYFRSRIRDEKY